MDSLHINSHLEIPLSEFQFRYVRSSGPGGQHVNKTSTQVELEFDLANSPSLSENDRLWLLKRLRTKLTADGMILITSQESRSQLRNKQVALEKFAEMIRQGLVRPKIRRATKPSKAAKTRRIESKKLHGLKKASRRSKED